ncbi:phosphoglycerate dehydrogenase [Sporolactobacillus kofuensis]|uniref:Phosphoglycerate dehydrogenase n=1 Tax=Sporolactobacillus kofuensis TaxID=269672 RepID=A0ABW1WB76_9BACL|nr:phosphoglycerate dehydrogenase [Sporolactobacillus kofuensis]MCO7174928.1 phosphoglycerate dehydrogenase [Sporolactobacillus kofuensis]
MRILFCVGKSYVPVYQSMVEHLEAMGAHVQCLMFDQALDKELIKKSIEDAQVYITAIAPCDKEVMDAAPQLNYVLKTGTGLDNVDLDYAKEKGILVSNAPGENATSVAELAFGQMISLSRMIPMLDRKTKSGDWPRGESHELSGKTVGIIGFGAIGKKIARFAGAFEMKIIAYGNYQDVEAAGRLGARFVAFNQLLTEADYIVISTALTASNYHLIDQQAIDLMKSTAFLVNISRGALIDEPILFKALRENRIAGAALDVFETEPPESVPDLDHLIVSPHIGGTTRESIARVAQVTVDNISKFMRNEMPDFLANQTAFGKTDN